MTVFNNALAGAAGSGGAAAYEIERSLRFNVGDSAYMHRQNSGSTTSSTKKFTLSFWVKRVDSASNRHVFFAAPGLNSWNNWTTLFFMGSGQLQFEPHISQGRITTVAKYLDFSAWSHFVLSVDSTLSTAADRVKIFHNGVRQEVTGTNANQDQTFAYGIASNYQQIGFNSSSYGMNGYLADMHFVDDQALDPTEFGGYDDDTGAWNPKRFSGTHGVNGWNLNFSDNSNTSALGTDSSSSSNNFTGINNFTVESPRTLSGVDFDGTNDHLQSADSADYSLGTNDFTIEAFIYPRTFDDYKALMMKYAGTASNSSWWWSLNSSGHILFYLYYGSSETGIVTSGTGMTLNKWNHVACVRDGSHSRVYINGVQVGTANIGTNSINDSTTPVRIGEDSQGFYDLNGIMSNVRLINGTCLYPNGTSFTVPTAPLPNVTNTKLLCCQSSSSSTAATVSPNALTTSGDPFPTQRSDSTSADDSLLDSPTNYDDGTNIGGNFCVLNPLNKRSNHTLSDGNLLSGSSSGTSACLGTMAFPKTGKWYYEAVFSSTPGYNHIGIATANANSIIGTAQPGYDTTNEFTYWQNGSKTNNVSYGAAFTGGDVIGVAFDADAGSLTFYKNGVSQGVNSTGLTGTYFPFIPGYDSYTTSVNFGQRPFSYTPPSGYKSLCTQNLADPSIADGSDYFDAVLYTGNGSTKTVSGLGFSPDWIWFKQRNTSRENHLYDSVRGVQKAIYSDLTSAEATDTDALSSFNSDGWTMGADGGSNQNNGTYVAWCWDGGNLVNNSNSSYNQSQTWSDGWTGQSGTSGRVPTNAFDGDLTTWAFPGNNGANEYVEYSFTAIPVNTSLEFYLSFDSGGAQRGQLWVNDTNVTSSLGSGNAQWFTVTGQSTLSKIKILTTATNYYVNLHAVRVDGKILIDPGVIPVGGLNTSVYDQSQTWTNQVSGTENSSYPFSNIFNADNMATHAYPANGTEAVFTPNPSFSNATTVKIWYYAPSMGANGMKLNGVSVGNQLPTTSGTLTKTFDVTGTGFTSLAWSKGVNSTDSGLLRIDVDGVQLVDNGVSVTNVPTLAASTVRANPSAGFSIVKYTGDGSNSKTVGHGLNAAPEMVFYKTTSTTGNWKVYHHTQTATKLGELNSTGSFSTNNDIGTAPTSNVISVSSSNSTYLNYNNQDYLALCFAPVPGFSIFTTFEGTGSADPVFVYCGFRPRYILKKNADDSKNWYIHDTARSPYNAVDKELMPHSNNAEGTHVAMDILSNGFAMRTSNAQHNASGNTYLVAAFAENPFKYARAR